MTRALVVVAHPDPTSFVHALADAAATALADGGHDVVVHDLYADRFDPVLHPEGASTTRRAGESAYTVGADSLTTRYRRDLAAAHTLVVAHPNWWGKPPAIMAGWIDRVVVPGVAYELPTGQGEPTPLLALRRLVVLNTGDTPLEREHEVFGDPLALVWERCVGAYLGDATVDRLLASPLAGSTLARRESWLTQARSLAARR
ncbi:NAD(P)H-dependent oxidoreductase [Oerskovia turbata]